MGGRVPPHAPPIHSQEVQLERLRTGPIAAVSCPVCGVSDSADAFFVKDPADGSLVCTVLRCVVAAALLLCPP
jgi:hypothetical protein